MQLTANKGETITFLQNYGILHHIRLCPGCGEDMELTEDPHPADGYLRRCTKRVCRKKLLLRTDNFPRQTISCASHRSHVLLGV